MSTLSKAIACVTILILTIASSGCIFSDPADEEVGGVVRLDMPVMFFTSDEGDTVHGSEVKGDVEGDVRYWWEYSGEVHEGTDIGLDGNGVYVRLASYHVEYLGYEQNVPVYFHDVNTSQTYAFVADGGYLEGYEDVTTYKHPLIKGIEGVVTDWVKPYIPHMPKFTLFNGVNHTVTGMVIEVKLSPNPGSTSYVAGFHWVEGNEEHDWVTTIAIHPWETHVLNYTGPGDLYVEITNITDPSEVFYKGDYKDLPDRYQTSLGHLEWVLKDDE